MLKVFSNMTKTSEYYSSLCFIISNCLQLTTIFEPPARIAAVCVCVCVFHLTFWNSMTSSFWLLWKWNEKSPTRFYLSHENAVLRSKRKGQKENSIKKQLNIWTTNMGIMLLVLYLTLISWYSISIELKVTFVLPGSVLWTGVAMLMSCRCSRVSVWKRRRVEPELKAIQMPTPATTMWDTTMPSSWWASSCLWREGTEHKHYRQAIVNL